jgi:NAD(P)-dependent dehydrogenase (short-subunit alcohol dehydrogenase family)
MINGRSKASVDAAIAALTAAVPAPHASAALLPLPGDVSSADGCGAIISGAAAHGDLDVLICNVGIFAVKPFEAITDEEWLRYFEVNVLSCARLARHFLPAMLARGWGRVVLVSSEVAERPLPTMVAYSVSKASQVRSACCWRLCRAAVGAVADVAEPGGSVAEQAHNASYSTASENVNALPRPALQVNLARGLAELTKGTAVTVNSLLPGPTWTEGVSTTRRGGARVKLQHLRRGARRRCMACALAPNSDLPVPRSRLAAQAVARDRPPRHP